MLQFIVLMTIMAIWALTSLLSREAQPLPPRPVRGPNPDGPRATPPVGRRDMSGPGRYLGTSQPLSSTAAERRAPPLSGLQSQGVAGARIAPARALSPDEGIVILESDARGTRAQPVLAPLSGSTTTRPVRGTQARRGGRGRAPSTSPASRPAEPGKPRALTSLVTQSMADMKARPLEIIPLSSPITPISTPLTQQTAGAIVQPAASANAPPAYDSSQLRLMFAKPNKLREIAVLTEVLGRPLALRAPARPR
jgi:hypothetical protein